MKKLLPILLVLSLLAIPAWAAKEVPHFCLKNVDGKMVKFEDLAGQYKLMAFLFWSTTCDPCKEELAAVNKWAGKYEGFKVVAVAVDSARTSSQVKPYIKGQGYGYEVLLDENGDLQKGLGVFATPFSFLITADGQITYEHSGYRKGDEKKLEEEVQKYFETNVEPTPGDEPTP